MNLSCWASPSKTGLISADMNQILLQINAKKSYGAIPDMTPNPLILEGVLIWIAFKSDAE